MSLNLDLFHIIEFQYHYIENKDSSFFFLIEDLEIILGHFNFSSIEKAKVYIRKPSWYEMHEIYRLSTKKDPYTKEKKIITEKIKENKLKQFLWKIEDFTGEVLYFNEEIIENLHPNLANFFLNEINDIIEQEGCLGGMTEDEERELSYNCFQYYSAIKKKRAGRKVEIPIPPAIIVLKRVCEMFNCTPDVARKISKEDIDKIFIANEQEYFCEDSKNIGMTDNKKHMGAK